MSRRAQGFLIVALVVFLSLLMQTTFFAFVRPKPDGVLAAVLAVSFLCGPVEGAAAGFAAGLAEDALSGMSHGAFCLTLTLLGLFMGFVIKRLNSNNFLVLLVCGVAGSLLEFWLFRLAAFSLGFASTLQPRPMLAAWLFLEGFICAGFLYSFRIWFVDEPIKGFSG